MLRVLHLPGGPSSFRDEALSSRLWHLGVEARVPEGEAASAAPTRWRSYLAGRRIAAKMKGTIPDLIHALGFGSADLAIELAERWRRPYVLTADAFLLPGQRLRIAKRWFRGVVVGNEELGDDLARGLGFPSRWVTVVGPGVELPDCEPRDRASYVPVVGTAVGAGFGSGLATFLQAARLVLDAGPEVEFVVAEAGDDSTFARRLAEGLGVIGRLTVAEGGGLEEIFWPVLDVYCHPSRWPAHGRALASAMARGLPTIASDLPVLRSMSDDGRACLLVPEGDAPALAGAIRRLLEMRGEAERLGLAGRARIASTLSPDREAEAMEALYRRAVAESKAGSARHRSDPGASAVARRLS